MLRPPRTSQLSGSGKQPARVERDALRVATSVHAREAQNAPPVDLARDLGAEECGELRHLRVAAEADQDVGEVDPGRAHVDDVLAVAGGGLGHVPEDEVLRPTDPFEQNCAQATVR